MGYEKGYLAWITIGDWGMSNEGQKMVASVMDKLSKNIEIDFVATVGDNFYPHGIQSAKDPRLQNSFEDVYNYPGLHCPWYITLGNHDYGGNIQAVIDYTSVSKRWNALDRYFFIDKKTNGKTYRFIFLDTTPMVTEYYENEYLIKELANTSVGVQTLWLEQVLSKEDEYDEVFIFGHHPLYTSGIYKKHSYDVASHIRNIFDRYNVKHYFSGHDHHQEFYTDETGFNQVVIGTGAENRSEIEDEIDSEYFNIDDLGVLFSYIKDDMYHLFFVDTNGKVRFSKTFQL